METITAKASYNTYHWVNHKIVINRVSGINLAVPNITFLPSVKDQQLQRLNYIVLVSRILVDHLKCFGMLKDVCVRHIPHKYSKEMATKSDDIIDILKKFQTYTPFTTGNGEKKFVNQLCVGDQLSVERAVNCIHSFSNGYTPEDRLE